MSRQLVKVTRQITNKITKKDMAIVVSHDAISFYLFGGVILPHLFNPPGRIKGSPTE